MSKDLLERARGGDRDAFGVLAESLRPRLQAFIRSRLGAELRAGGSTVEDILQETLLRAFASLERFEWRGEDSLFRWLASIAGHEILDHARRHRRRTLRLEREVERDEVSPSRALRRGERLDRLSRALASLAPDHRQVITLARLEGLPLEEVARRMDRSANAASHLLLRALRELRAAFGDTESLRLPPARLPREEGADGR